jgi:hypothetical protein
VVHLEKQEARAEMDFFCFCFQIDLVLPLDDAEMLRHAGEGGKCGAHPGVLDEVEVATGSCRRWWRRRWPGVDEEDVDEPDQNFACTSP